MPTLCSPGPKPGPKAGPYLAPIVLPAGGVVKARAFSENRKQMSELAEAKFEPLPDTAPVPTTLVPCTQDRDWPTYDWAVRHAAVTSVLTTLVFSSTIGLYSLVGIAGVL